MNTKSRNGFRQEIKDLVRRQLNKFFNWLKPDPADHWFLRTLKLAGKLPLVLLFIICSPVLFIVFLLIFLIAL